jgi:hypothetical protein
MLGFGALGEFALGEVGGARAALTSDILQEVVTLLINEKFLPELPPQLHHFRGRFEIGCQACSSSSSALASFRSSVSKPSVNQP